MKKRTWLLFGFTTVIVLSSCNEDKILSGANQLVKSISIKGQDFQSGEPGTKAAYTVDGTGMHFSWTEGDTVGIYPVGGDQVAFPISSGEGSQTAQFDGGAWALRASFSYAAYYPYVKGNYMVDETQIPVIFIGQKQNGNGSLDCLDRFDYQASLATNPDVDGNVSIELKHLACFVRFQFSMPIADTYQSITFTSSKTPFVTSGTFDLTKDEIEIIPNTSSSTITVSLNNTSTTGDNKVLTVYAMFAPTNLSDGEISISIEGTTYKSYSATVSGKNMIAGKAYSYTAKVQSGTNINGSDVEWDDEGNEIGPQYEYVDLGLSVNWATINIGASKPEDYGEYFSWGEIEPQPLMYSQFTYKYYNGKISTLTKYCNVSKYGNNGLTDGKSTLEAADDIAKVRWGGSWRIPTQTEFKELVDYCSWTWTTQDGVNGYKVTSNMPGYTDRSIFLPAAGNYGSHLVNLEKCGCYWSCSLDNGYPDYAYYLGFSSTSHYLSRSTRYDGYTIRPVWSKGTWESITSISLNKSIHSIELGDDIILSAILIKDGESVFNPNNQISWSSSDNTVATVDSYGKVTTLSIGETVITASFSSVKAECEITVTSFASTGLEQSHDYVDLGLSVKWATVNIGADKIEDYGDHFAWGETSIKNSYTWDNYKYRISGDSRDNVTFSKYNTDNARGVVDNKTTLDMVDDVANVQWGGSWRLPTQAEFVELIKNCTWTWTTRNGVNGFRITSKKSGYLGRSIFLPANPSLEGSPNMEVFLKNAPFYIGYYWSSSLCTFDMTSAWRLVLGASYNDRTYETLAYDRYVGQSVRPVCP